MNDLVMAVDCSLRWTSVGISRGKELLGCCNLNLGRKQASQLPVVVGQLLESLDLSLKDLGYLAVTVGPGYFTGIRIGMSYVMGLAEALNIDVVPVSSLDFVASHLVLEGSGKAILPLIPAAKDRIFSSLVCDGELLYEEKERSPLELMDIVADYPSLVAVAVGDPKLDLGFLRGVTPCVVLGCPDGGVLSLASGRLLDLAVSSDLVRASYLREPGLGG